MIFYNFNLCLHFFLPYQSKSMVSQYGSLYYEILFSWNIFKGFSFYCYLCRSIYMSIYFDVWLVIKIKYEDSFSCVQHVDNKSCYSLQSAKSMWLIQMSIITILNLKVNSFLLKISRIFTKCTFAERPINVNLGQLLFLIKSHCQFQIEIWSWCKGGKEGWGPEGGLDLDESIRCKDRVWNGDKS